MTEIGADPALAEDREVSRARVRALRDLYHGDRAFPSDCPSGRRLAAAARSYLGRWPYDREVQDAYFEAMVLSWRYGEAYDYYRELRKDPREALRHLAHVGPRQLPLSRGLHRRAGAREALGRRTQARHQYEGDWLPPDVPPYG